MEKNKVLKIIKTEIYKQIHNEGYSIFLSELIRFLENEKNYESYENTVNKFKKNIVMN